MGLQDEGSITFRLKHEHPDWPTNEHAYNFGTLDTRGIQGTKVTATKHPDRTLELDMDGPFDQHHNVRLPIPICDERGLFVAITWQKPDLKIYLNGALADTITV